jgi:hypothetical protein
MGAFPYEVSSQEETRQSPWPNAHRVSTYFRHFLFILPKHGGELEPLISGQTSGAT